MRLSNGKRGAAVRSRAARAGDEDLDADATTLLSRATPIKSDAADQQTFALRPDSQPVPRTGKTITGQFPPPPSSLLPPASNNANKDLTVLRYMPEGKVPLAPELSITFSQPMVAVTSQGDAAATQPVTLTPTPPGKWRWIGTRTILFDPEIRFPQATTYTVEIPAGTKSAEANALKAPVKFTFETPPPSLVSTYPDDVNPQHTDTPMFVMFDQKIDAQAVLGMMHVTANGKAFKVQQLTPAELEKNKELTAQVAAAKQNDMGDRWIAFRAAELFPTNAAVEVEIPVGTPSREGPNKTTARQSFAFRTYPPFEVSSKRCGWSEDKKDCHPGTPFQIVFDNPIDVDKFDESEVTITPAIPDVKIEASNSVLTINGLTSARTCYKVVLASSLRDEFCQTLGKPTTVTFEVADAEPTFFGTSSLVVLDAGAKAPSLDFFTVNYDHLKVSLYRVTPDDYGAYEKYIQEQWNHDHPPRMPGKKVFDGLVATTPSVNQLVREPRRSRQGARQAKLRRRDRDRRAVAVEGELSGAAHDLVGAVDQARRRRLCRRRQPDRVRDRPRDRRAGRQRRARDPAARPDRDDRRQGHGDDAADEPADERAQHASRQARR